MIELFSVDKNLECAAIAALQDEDEEEIYSLAPSDFEGKLYRDLFTECQRRHDSGEPFDLVAAAEASGHEAAEVLPITEVPLGMYGARDLVKKIRLRNSRRLLRGELAKLIEKIDGADDNEAIVDELQQIASRDRYTGGDRLCDLAEALPEAIADLGDEIGGKRGGIPTGFPRFDRVTRGLQRGRLYVLCGRPSSGKSALALNVAVHAARKGKHVVYCSLEMTESELARRVLYSEGRFAERELFSDNADAAMEKALDTADECTRQFGKRLLFYNVGGMTPATAKRIVKAAQRRGQCDLLVVDYLGLMKPNRQRQQRYIEVGEVVNELKALAIECDLPVLALSQMNRETDARDDKRPRMSDLRESGDLEQTADLVMAVHRPALFGLTDDRTKAELYILKNRCGETGVIEYHFDGAFYLFQELKKE